MGRQDRVKIQPTMGRKFPEKNLANRGFVVERATRFPAEVESGAQQRSRSFLKRA